MGHRQHPQPALDAGTTASGHAVPLAMPNMIAAIDRPTAGELLVQGDNVFRYNDSKIAEWRSKKPSG